MPGGCSSLGVGGGDRMKKGDDDSESEKAQNEPTLVIAESTVAATVTAEAVLRVKLVKVGDVEMFEAVLKDTLFVNIVDDTRAVKGDCGSNGDRKDYDYIWCRNAWTALVADGTVFGTGGPGWDAVADVAMGVLKEGGVGGGRGMGREGGVPTWGFLEKGWVGL